MTKAYQSGMPPSGMPVECSGMPGGMPGGMQWNARWNAWWNACGMPVECPGVEVNDNDGPQIDEVD